MMSSGAVPTSQEPLQIQMMSFSRLLRSAGSLHVGSDTWHVAFAGQPAATAAAGVTCCCTML